MAVHRIKTFVVTRRGQLAGSIRGHWWTSRSLRSMDEFARVPLGTCIITGGVLREFNLFVTCISTHIIPGTNDYFYSHSRKVLQHVSPNGHTHINTLSQQPRNFVNSVTCPAFYFQFYFKCNRFILSNNRCAGSCFIRAALRNQGTPLLGLGAILVPAVVREQRK